MALVGGLFGLVLWLVALESGVPYFTALNDLLRTPVGQGALYVLAVSAMYHLAAGLRHLLWDAGRGFNPKFAEFTAWMAIVFALVAPLGIWALAKL
jgi:succinate dehydrogenase / fumarate reductase cytochrome b subunit